MSGELVSILAPIYLIVALGYVWARAGRRFDVDLVSDLIMNVGAPSLVFSSFSSLEMDATVLLAMSGLTVLALGSFALVGFLVLRVAGLPAHTFLAPLTFVNSGNMGLPLCFFAFGEEGLALAVCFFAVTSLLHFTLGQWLWSGHGTPGVVLRTPLAWAAVASAACLGTGVEVPEWLARTTELLGSFTIPLMQFSLGVSLARLQLADLPRTGSLAVFRTLVGIGIGVGLAGLLGLTGVMRGVFVLDCAMPSAVINYMMAERYGRSPQEVASIVVLSTLIAFAVLPVLLAWLLPTL